MGASEELPRVKDEAVGRLGRSVGLPEAPTAPKLDIWAVLVSLVLNPWSWPVLSWFAWVHGLVLIQLSLTRVF